MRFASLDAESIPSYWLQIFYDYSRVFVARIAHLHASPRHTQLRKSNHIIENGKLSPLFAHKRPRGSDRCSGRITKPRRINRDRLNRPHYSPNLHLPAKFRIRFTYGMRIAIRDNACSIAIKWETFDKTRPLLRFHI